MQPDLEQQQQSKQRVCGKTGRQSRDFNRLPESDLACSIERCVHAMHQPVRVVMGKAMRLMMRKSDAQRLCLQWYACMPASRSGWTSCALGRRPSANGATQLLKMHHLSSQAPHPRRLETSGACPCHAFEQTSPQQTLDAALLCKARKVSGYLHEHVGKGLAGCRC